jgi:hypothetical protein
MEKATPTRKDVKKEQDRTGKGVDETFGTDHVWKEALKRYEAENNITKDELVVAGTIGSADQGVERAAQLFTSWRHPPGEQNEVIKSMAGLGIGSISASTRRI